MATITEYALITTIEPAPQLVVTLGDFTAIGGAMATHAATMNTAVPAQGELAPSFGAPASLVGLPVGSDRTNECHSLQISEIRTQEPVEAAVQRAVRKWFEADEREFMLLGMQMVRALQDAAGELHLVARAAKAAGKQPAVVYAG